MDELSVKEINAQIDTLDFEIAKLRAQKKILAEKRKERIVHEAAVSKLKALKPEELKALGIAEAVAQHVRVDDVANVKLGKVKK